MTTKKPQPANAITDNSKEKEYFIVTPQMVWALSRTPQDFTLWNVIKMITGETGECHLSTPDLATLAMMSEGKVSDCRQYLISAGLLVGELRKDPDYPQSVWRLRIPDIWEENIRWRKGIDSLKDRVALKAYITQELKAAGCYRDFDPQKFQIHPTLHNMNPNSLHNMKPSQYEEGITQNEEGITQNETKKNQKEEPERRTASPPSGKPAKDYLTDVVTLQGQTSEVTAPAPADQWLNYRDEALAIYQRLSGAWGHTPQEREVRKGLIAGGVADRADFDPARFEKSIIESLGAGVGAANIARFWEVYDAGGTYAAWKAKTYGNNGQNLPTSVEGKGRAPKLSPEALALAEEWNKQYQSGV